MTDNVIIEPANISNDVLPEDQAHIDAMVEAYGTEDKIEEEKNKPLPYVAPECHPKLDMSGLPTGNFVRDYYEHHKKETPATYPEYHHAGAMALLDMATGRKLYITVGGDQIFSNTWSMMIGSSTVAKKSVAIGIAKRMLEDRFSSYQLGTMWSGAGLFETLSKHPFGFMINDECAQVLENVNNSKEARSVRDTMCRLYDCPKTIKKTLSSSGKQNNNGDMEIVNGFPVILWATTPENFSSNSTLLDVNSGWLLRFLYYYPDYPKDPVKIRFGYDRNFTDKKINDRYNAICDKLNTYDKIVATPTKEAERVYHEWHMRREKEIDQQNKRYEGAFGRLEIMVLKLAMKYQISKPEFLTKDLVRMISHGNDIGASLHIDEDVMRVAISHIDDFFLPHAIAVIDRVEQDSSKNIQLKILAMLKENGGLMKKRDVSKNLNTKIYEVNEHLEALEDQERIVQFDNKDELNRAKKPTSYIQLINESVGRELIMSRKSIRS